jgi:hypothetical protein
MEGERNAIPESEMGQPSSSKTFVTLTEPSIKPSEGVEGWGKIQDLVHLETMYVQVDILNSVVLSTLVSFSNGIKLILTLN